MSLSTPVAFIIFNRPDLTQRVFQAIRQAQPQQLLVIADGPRADRPSDVEKCAAARAVIDKVDWNCEVLTNFSETNLGCGKRPATGLDWVFSQVDEAIILEDDCLPAASFFAFCQTLLETYRHDERIMLISGNNFQNEQSRTNYSYYFSKYPLTWGWATWKRTWNRYDYSMKSWPVFKQLDLLKFVCKDSYEHKYWMEIFDQMYENPENIRAWDHQLAYTCFSQSGLCIIPDTNLVSNLGFGTDSTHFQLADHSHGLLNIPANDIWEIKHPPFIVQHEDADLCDFDHVFGGREMRNNAQLLQRIFRKASSLKKRIFAS